jgi:hypothetical protein
VKKQRKKKSWDGNVKVFWFTISLNTILTTIFGSVGCLLVGIGLHWVSGIASNISSIPQMKADMKTIITEQARVRAEYHPPTNPADPPPPSPHE